MAFSEVAPSINVLNGGSDEGGVSKSTTVKPKKVVKSTASQNHSTVASTSANTHTVNTPAVPSEQTTVATVVTVATPTAIPSVSTDQHSSDLFFLIVLPLFIVGFLVWGFMKLLIRDIRKNPPRGGFSHKHKKHHPGKMNPRILK